MRLKFINLRMLFVLTILIQGCVYSSKISTVDKTQEDLRDVFILTILTRDYLRSEDQLNFNLDKLMERDSLGRISNNFEKITFIMRGGHIAIQYKFSNNRDYKVRFTDKESQMSEYWNVQEKNKKSEFDGEIQFEYGEKFYNFRKIIVWSQ